MAKQSAFVWFGVGFSIFLILLGLIGGVMGKRELLLGPPAGLLGLWAFLGMHRMDQRVRKPEESERSQPQNDNKIKEVTSA
jgi:hypothetical protein